MTGITEKNIVAKISHFNSPKHCKKQHRSARKSQTTNRQTKEKPFCTSDNELLK
jgi:hypothetical protein